MRKLISTENFIEKCKEKYEDKFFYDKVIFQGYNKKILLGCPLHGYFVCYPKHLLYNDYHCPFCQIDKQRKSTEQFIIDAKQVHGDKYDYSKVEYKNNKTKVCIICPKHGEFWQTPHNHLKGNKCLKCSLEEKNKKKATSQDKFIIQSKEIFGNKFKYELVNYKNNKTPITLICNECGNIFNVRPDNHLNKHSSCPKCTNKISKWQNEIAKFLTDNNIKIEIGNRTILNGKEIDILAVDFNVGIECDGLFYHSNLCNKNSNYHLNKREVCLKKDIELIHIIEDEWYFQKNHVKSLILHKLKLTPQKIMGRKCIIKIVNETDKQDFLLNNNIENKLDVETINYGLYYQNELVCLMCCIVQEGELLIKRFNHKLFCYVNGGFNKLLTVFKTEYNINQISIESEKRYFFNKSLIVNGFQKKHTIKPIKNEIINLKRKKNVNENKYFIYDCGLDVFSKHI